VTSFWQVPVLLFIALLVGMQLLRKTLDFTKLTRAKNFVTFFCFCWLTVALAILLLPITGLIFSLFGYRWMGAAVLTFLLFCFFLWWGLDIALEENGSAQFWQDWWSIQEKLLLLLLLKKDHDEYHWHIRWRFLLLGRKIVRKWERLSLTDFLAAQRWLWVLLAALAAVAIIKFVLGDDAIDAFKKQLTADSHANAGAWSLLTLLAGAPIAFLLWKFRDANALWQIENQRKDTNLKDFQQLSQWASGLHLIEGKEINTETRNATGLTITKEIERNIKPQINWSHSLSMRDGASGLQISAIHQLTGFLSGDFGKQFVKPTFILLKSLWQALVQTELEKQPSDEEVAYKYHLNLLLPWVNNIQQIAKNPIASAISCVIAQENGYQIKKNCFELPSSIFSGFDFSIPGLNQPIELDGLNLNGIQLQGAQMSFIEFQESSFEYANLMGSYIKNSKFQNSIFYLANLHHAIFVSCEMQNAAFTAAQLNCASFYNSKLQGCNFLGAQIKSTSFQNSNLQGAIFINPIFDNKTNFKNAKTDINTLFTIKNDGFTSIQNNLTTHLLRKKLIQNDLILDSKFYLEHELAWLSASPSDKFKAEYYLGQAL
jgi:uncharacterized protein YjbI with pentapeptide repeats